MEEWWISLLCGDGICDLPVMGDDNDFYSEGYIQAGEVPSFKLYHSDTGELEDLHGTIDGFSNNELFFVDGLNTDDIILPTQVTLNNAYPNPFNPVTNITFSIPTSMNVELNVLDIQGRVVESIMSGVQEEGEHHAILNGEDLSSGVYFIQLLTSQGAQYSKVILLK